MLPGKTVITGLEVRPIPLTDIEIRSLQVSDSIKTSYLKKPKNDTISATGNEEKSRFFRTVRKIALGNTWSDTSGFRFTNGGLIDLKNLTFNTVDGFTYGLDFRFSKSWKNNTSISFFPDVRWAFSREQLMWRAYMKL